LLVRHQVDFVDRFAFAQLTDEASRHEGDAMG
jgi:hypothetical protein